MTAIARWLAALLLVVAVPAKAASWGADWKSIRSACEALSTIQADFVQEKHLPILAEPIVSRGRLVYRGRSLRWEYTDPAASVLIVDNGKTSRYDIVDGKPIADTGAAVQSVGVVMEQIVDWFRGRFAENKAFEAAIEDEGRIVLTPRRPAMKRYIRRVELVLSETPGVMESVKIVEGDDAYTLMRFVDVKTGEPVPDDAFQVDG